MDTTRCRIAMNKGVPSNKSTTTSDLDAAHSRPQKNDEKTHNTISDMIQRVIIICSTL